MKRKCFEGFCKSSLSIICWDQIMTFVTSSPWGGHFPGEKSSLSSEYRSSGSRSNSSVCGRGLSLGDPHGAEGRASWRLPAWAPLASSLSPVAAAPASHTASHTIDPSLISGGLNKSNGKILRREIWKIRERFIKPWLLWHPSAQSTH